MKIGEFSKITEITIDTLRYYNKIGLIVPEKINKRWLYTEEDTEKAAIIIKLKNLNFSLDEIKSLFDLEKDISETQRLDKESIEKITCCLNIIEEKHDEIVKKEKDLLQIKAVLENMIGKTKTLLEKGCFPNNIFEKNYNVGDRK